MDSYEELPCRIVMQTKTRCPKCNRSITIKTLKYTHVCGRTVEERVHEEERKAQAKHKYGNLVLPARDYRSLLSQINQTTGSSSRKSYVEMSFGKVRMPYIP